MANDSAITKFMNEWAAEVIKERRDYLYHEQGLIFQRFNYFLIGTSFLITAFAALASSQKFCPNGEPFYIFVIANSVGILGLIIAALFTVINFLVTYSNKILSEKIIKHLNLGLNEWVGSSWNQKQLGGWIKVLFCSIFLFIFCPFNPRIRGLASHLFMFPLFFVFFWLIAISALFGWPLVWQILSVVILGVIGIGALWHLALFIINGKYLFSSTQKLKFLGKKIGDLIQCSY